MKIHASGALFDIVIRGRGTWAAACSLACERKFMGESIEPSERSRSSARQHMK
jgi:hypothetical protein